MKIPALSIPRYAASILSLLVIAVSACDSAPVHPTAPAVPLPLNATIESRYANLVTAAPRIVVTISAYDVEIHERLQTGSAREYRLEPSSSEVSTVSTHDFNSLSRPRIQLRLDEESPCKLRPGVYAIVEPTSGTVVGILIVYPDCRMEVYTG